MSHRCQSILVARNGRLLSELASVSADLEDGHVIPEHSHPEDQLLFASSGVMTLRTKQGVWVVPPLRAVWIPANTPHSVEMSGPVSMRTLYFLPKLCRKFSEKCFVMNVSALLRELILHACKFKRLSKRALDRLCKDCGASKRTIQRVFLEETKMNFGKWRQQLRLLHGLQLLASGEKVTAAALEAGYSSPSAFISMFRKQLGTTPTRYLADGNGREQREVEGADKSGAPRKAAPTRSSTFRVAGTVR